MHMGQGSSHHMLQVQAGNASMAMHAALMSASTRRGVVKTNFAIILHLIDPRLHARQGAASDARGLVQKYRARRGVTNSISPRKAHVAVLLCRIRARSGLRGLHCALVGGRRWE